MGVLIFIRVRRPPIGPKTAWGREGLIKAQRPV